MNNPFVLTLIVLITAVINTVGQTLLKKGAGQNPLNIYILMGLVAYALSTVFYIAILGKLNLSIVYPVVFGLTIISTTLAGIIILHEQVTFTQWIGVGLLLSGISAIAFGKV